MLSLQVNISKMVFTYFCTQMELKMQVVSSNIKTADYDRTTQRLTLIFVNRPRWVYTYYHVSPKVWVEFLKAQSKGTYFSAAIKDNYNYRRTILK